MRVFNNRVELVLIVERGLVCLLFDVERLFYVNDDEFRASFFGGANI